MMGTDKITIIFFVVGIVYGVLTKLIGWANKNGHVGVVILSSVLLTIITLLILMAIAGALLS